MYIKFQSFFHEDYSELYSACDLYKFSVALLQILPRFRKPPIEKRKISLIWKFLMYTYSHHILDQWLWDCWQIFTDFTNGGMCTNGLPAQLFFWNAKAIWNLYCVLIYKMQFFLHGTTKPILQMQTHILSLVHDHTQIKHPKVHWGKSRSRLSYVFHFHRLF